MTGRTHDLAAMTSLVYVMANHPLPQMSLATGIVTLGANMIGGLAPDLDEPTADLWRRIPAGSIWGRIIHPLMGGHRLISHSLLGMWLMGMLVRFMLTKISPVLLVNMDIVWWGFMIGYTSHLITDTVTKEGVPWFFPIPVRLGFPPFKFLRMTTGALTEKAVVFPGLILLNGYLIYTHYGIFLNFVRHLK